MARTEHLCARGGCPGGRSLPAAPSQLFFVGPVVGAISGGFAISATFGMSVKRATIAAGLYTGLLGAILLLSSLSGLSQDQIVGTWSDETLGRTSIAVFNEDGTYTMVQGTEPEFIQKAEQRLSGAYHISGNKLIMTTQNGGTMEPEIRLIDDDSLRMIFRSTTILRSGSITLDRNE